MERSVKYISYAESAFPVSIKMIKTIFAYIQLIHVAVILWLTVQLYQHPNTDFDITLIIAEIVLTLIDIFVIRKTMDMTSFLLSCSLLSFWIP